MLKGTKSAAIAFLLLASVQQAALAADDVAPPHDPTLVPTRAQDFEQHKTAGISLRQAQDLGLRYNRDLLVAKQSLLSAQYSLRRTQAQYYPTLNLNAGASNGLSSGDSYAAGITGVPARNAWAADPGVQVVYDVGTDGSRSAQVDLGGAQVKVAELEVDRQRLTLAQQIANAYYDLQFADQQVRIAHRDHENAVRSMHDTEVLKKAGIQTIFEMQRAQVYEARTRSVLVNAEASRRVSRRSLARILGLAFDAQVEATDSVTLVHGWSLSLPETIASAVRTRPEVGEARWQERAGEAQIRLAKSTGQPHLSVSAGADTLLLPGYGLGYTGGVNLQLPLFEGGASRAGQEAARADRQGSAIRLADAASQIQLQAEQAYAQMESSKANVDTTAVALRTAQDSLKSARIRFQAGVGTQTELILAENDLSQADLDAINAVLGYNRAIATLDALVAK